MVEKIELNYCQMEMEMERGCGAFFLPSNFPKQTDGLKLVVKMMLTNTSLGGIMGKK